MSNIKKTFESFVNEEYNKNCQSEGEEIINYHDDEENPKKIYCYKGWYAVKGSNYINYTDEEIDEDTNIEEIEDKDTLTTKEPINSLFDLKEQIDELDENEENEE